MTAGHGQGQLLAQVRPSGTTAVTLLTASQLPIEVTLILACVRRGAAGAVDIDVFHDDDGTTFGDDTQILSANRNINDEDIIFQAQHPGSGIMLRPGGSLGVEISVANEVNFSVYGVTSTIAERVRPNVG